MPADLTTVHVNNFLTNFSIALENEDNQYLLNKICGRVPVNVISDSFVRYGRELQRTSTRQSNARMLASVTAPGAPAAELFHTVTSGSYACRRYSLREFVSDAEITKADSPLQPIQDAAKLVRRRVMNDAELVLALIVADADNYNASNKTTLTTGANGTSWNKASAAGTGSEPLTDIRTARVTVEKIISRPCNVLAMSAETKYHLNDHDDLKNIIQYTAEDYLEGEGIPDHIRGLRLVAGKATYDTVAEGGTFSGDYLFNDVTNSNKEVAIVCHVPPGKTCTTRDFASFLWFDAPDETTRARGVSHRAYRDDARRGWWVEAGITFDVQFGVVDGSSLCTGAYGIFDAIA